MKAKLLGLFLPLLLVITPVFSGEATFIDGGTRSKVKTDLLQKYGDGQKFRIERGVDQAADFWRQEDGDQEEFSAYCRQSFIGDKDALDADFKKLEFYSEILNGYFGEMGRDMNQPVDLDWGEIMPIDMAMSSFDPAAHLSEDLFQNKTAFFVLLNFPRYTLAEMMQNGPQWSRQEWAFAREGDSIRSRIPAVVSQKISAIMNDAHAYVSQYNIFMGNLVDDTMKPRFPADMKLLEHWGLRDEIRARYANKNDLSKQQMIYKVMDRIIRQEIPEKVVNSAKYQWNPLTNKVYENGQEVSATPEPNTRYKTLQSTYEAMKLVDPYRPDLPTFIQRSFGSEKEIPEKDVEAMFVGILSSPEVPMVGKLIEKRLGRKLQPFDIWYTGFRGDTSAPEEELDEIVAQKYPTLEAFQNDIPDILIKLGFTKEDADFIAPKIQVDPARGSGHCAGTSMHRFKVRLRTRLTKNGMNYKGYNIAIHELGHSIESVLTLHKMDYYSLSGVPNNAFTEAFAFLFQDRDLDLLGFKKDTTLDKEMKALDIFWNSYEGMGVSLVEMYTWHWMYDHPNATPEELKQAVLSIAKDVWNRYYAGVFGIKDQVILAVYQHMIDYTLYLPNYAIANIIQFQIENYLQDKPLGPDMKRMCASGSILPQAWMKNAVGSEINIKPMLQAVDIALKMVR